MQCPSCHKEVSVEAKDIGALYTCPECRSVYFLGFDGVPEYGEVEQPSSEDLAKLQNLHTPLKKKSKKKKDSSESEVDAPIQEQRESAIAQADQSFVESSELPIEQGEQTFESEFVPIESLPTETPTIENFAYESVPLESNEVNSLSDFSSVASEIEKFGNQQTFVSGLTYDLEITAIDTKESMALLKEAIDDMRFGWVVDDLVREIKSGTCKFKDLSPVQAFILARRIQFLDIQMKWIQNVIA